MMVNLPCLKGSCPNFLRPTCPYTECLPSLQTGSCPTETTTTSYSSCFYFDFTDLLFPQGTVFRRRFPLPQPAGHCDDAVRFALHRYRVTFQNPARFQFPLEPGRVLDKSVFVDWFYVMLQPLPDFQGAWCPLTSFSDHRLFRSLGLQKWFSEVYKLSLSATASFSGLSVRVV